MLIEAAPSTWGLLSMSDLLARPRLLALLCGVGASCAGIAYMAIAGAPPRYLLINLAALVLGATAWLALGTKATSRLGRPGPLIVISAMPLLLTAFFGLAVEGAARWVSLGPLTLQLSLILLPVMLVLYARHVDITGTIGILIAVFGLAVQPDRAMAGALAAGLVAVLVTRRDRLAQLATALSLIGLAWTLLLPDRLPATPYVDGILYTSFDLHPLVGAAVATGAFVSILPLLARTSGGLRERAPLLAFGACWMAVIAAALLGNYPTPLVGYGGSAVLGYLLSAALLPGGRAEPLGSSIAQASGEADAPQDKSISKRHDPQPV